jgi:hypothetical protein
MNAKPSATRRESQHHAHRIAAGSAVRSGISKRRSSRMALHASVGLSGEDRKKCSFEMPAKATNLNRHGAAVQLNRELQIGSVVKMKNQRGTQVTARVVAQLAALHGVSTYGIEFVEHDETSTSFWGISFPSA